MKQIPKNKLDAILKEALEAPNDSVIVPNQFIIDIVKEVKKLRYKVSNPKRAKHD